MRLPRRWLCRAALAALCLGFAAPLVHARAGGGHSYSGGSSGGGFSGGRSSYSGGSSSRRSSGPDFLTLYLLWASRNPLIGFPLTLFLLYLFFVAGQQGHSRHVGSTIRRGVEAQASHLREAGFEKIRARDPAFDEAAFLRRVKNGFLKTQEAWSRQDMRAVRAFLSDGVFERFRIYLEMQKALGFRNAMEGVSVLASAVIQAESDPHFDTLHVRIDAAATDYDVSLEGRKVLRNEMKRQEPFTEIWSFLRRPGAKTLAKPGLIEGACPNCGSPLEIADSAKCGACDSWVNSGEYDWVLAEITQACEWKPLRTGAPIPGLADLAPGDPALNAQFLEDRASVAFWRWQIAHWEESAASLAGVAVGAVTAALLDSQKTDRALYKNAAVGGVDALAFEAGEPMDRAHVQVRWSAEKYRVVDGEAEPDGQAVCCHVFIFGRKHGVKTDARSGLRSARCPSCGAPPSERTQAACEYCSAPFNDGSRDWTLLEITPRGRWRMPAMASSAARPSPAAPSAAAARSSWDGPMSPGDALAVLVAGMVMDGVIEQREVDFARSYARKNSIPEKRIEALVASARAGKLEVPRPSGPQQAVDYMRGLIDMSFADGTVSNAELRTLLAFGERMRLPPAQVKLMVNTERSRLYQEAKAALKRPTA